MVELRPTHEIEQFVEISFTLARVSDQKSRAKHEIWDAIAQPADQIANPAAAVAASHPSQHGITCVLQRHIDVGQDDGMFGEQLDQRFRERFGVEVMQPEPAQSWHVGQARGQFGQGRAIGEVAPPGDGVLADKANLDDTRCDQRCYLAGNIFERPRPLLAPDSGYGAEAASTVAALGDLDKGAVSALCQAPRIIGADDPVGRISDQDASGAVVKNLAQPQHIARTEKMVDLWHFDGELSDVALR